MKTKTNVLVTDGNSRASLAITRSLGAYGYNIFVGDKNELSLASSSKYCHQAIKYPDPVLYPEEFLEKLASIVNTYDIDLLIPVTDVCVIPISESVIVSNLSCKIPIPNKDTLHLAANKNELVRFASELGVNVPDSQTIESFDDLESLKISISYPVVIKPSRSRVLVDGKWKFTSVDYADNKKALLSKLKNIHSKTYPVMIQERILGPGIGAFYCYEHGKCITKFSHRRIREKPPSGGVSVLRESIGIDPIVDEHSQILLDRLKWHGVAMVEYKYDEKRNIPYLMEINGRFWGSLQLAIDSGVDFPKHLADISSGKQKPINEEYKIGVKTRWLWGDIDLLLMLLFKSKHQLHLASGSKSRWRIIIDILIPFGRNLHYEVLRISDIKPWLFESKMWLKEVFSTKN
ncbi:MAG: ATP-grasp domain-containing protein [Candidatus Thiodiazotropha sp. (ex Lucinoma borealis)]|nr:ATP-grasp domain-containing protein [Candidatus Thiodiazotropha sp. (ex Lucinoma borealis)]